MSKHSNSEINAVLKKLRKAKFKMEERNNKLIITPPSGIGDRYYFMPGLAGLHKLKSYVRKHGMKI
jgi:uncharacterized cupin superfamily protein